jgi:predicted SAM-dependent methyltransferase
MQGGRGSATRTRHRGRRLPAIGNAIADRIFLLHVLEHLIDFLSLVDECHRVPETGGTLHVSSP